MRLTSVLTAISGARSALIASLAVAGLCLPLGYCTGFKTASAAAASDRAEATLKIRSLESEAKEAAARERLADKLAVQQQAKDLNDAIKSIPDAAPGAVGVALGCERLRKSGTRDADLPVVCRPAGGGGAQTAAAARDRDQRAGEGGL